MEACLLVRPARPADRELLLDLRERSVRATHDFLSGADIVALRPAVAAELASDDVAWWVLHTTAGTTLGFLGYTPGTIEALFIDPDHRGQGAGPLLHLVRHEPPSDSSRHFTPAIPTSPP